MRFIVGTAVDDRRECRRHLDHRTVIALSEGVYRKVCRAHIVRIVDQSICLSRKIDSGLLTHAE